MFAFIRNSRRGSRVALALALAGTTALGTVALETPAFAQKEKKKKDEKAQKTNYSKGFIAAYTAAEDLSKAGNMEGAKAQIPAVVAAIQTDDDRNAAGGMLVNVGGAVGDQAMQLQGVELMLASGKLDPTKVGSVNYTAYQLASQAGDQAKSRGFLEKAIAEQYTFEGKLTDGTSRTFGPDDLHAMLAESFFEENKYSEGFAYMTNLIAARAAAGGTVPQTWITRPLGVAYNNDQPQAAMDFGKLFVQFYPSETSWGDAIAIQRNTVDYDPQQTLDILRLGLRTGALRDTRSYVDYIEAADARRLPGEVTRVVDAGIAAGKLKANDVFVNEAKTTASGRINADKADLPALERDAKAANATALTATAAGDAFLSYQEWAKAEAMYLIAATKPGADLGRVHTRLGIAQLELGKTAEALDNFGKVDGARKNIADLWALYAKQKSAPTM